MPERFLSDNPHFARSALRRYTPQDFIGLVERHGIAFHEKTLGQLFCNGSAREMVAMLLQEAEAAGVTIQLGARVRRVSKGENFTVEADGETLTCQSLVLATGGLSIPKMGATSFTHDLARQFGLRITELRPGLVPLTFNDELLEIMRPLSGVAFGTRISAGRNAFSEAALFTHRGLSGPAILQISSYWRAGPITLDLLPGIDALAFLLDRKRSRPKSELRTILGEALPQRLALTLAASVDSPSTRIADLPDRKLRDLSAQLSAWSITPNGSEGYAKAEVTVGGVDTRDLSSQTMQANAVPGLFVIGEAVDVTGWLGGYNFQWAWASGYCAGQVA